MSVIFPTDPTVTLCFVSEGYPLDSSNHKGLCFAGRVAPYGLGSLESSGYPSCFKWDDLWKPGHNSRNVILYPMLKPNRSSLRGLPSASAYGYMK